jgi:D-3-phosphoglycerate dehydrogenase / 2-oxoglutarate reductase
MLKCLVIDPMHESIFPLMKDIGWELDYQPLVTRDEIRRIHHHYEGLIVRSKTRIDEDLLGDAPRLRFIGRAGAGIDNVDVSYCNRKNIAVLHAAEGNRDAVGEFTIGLLLALLRNIPRSDQQVKNSIWEREGNRGEELMGKTVGVIGFGNMGQAFCKRLAGFGCKILAYDKYKKGFGSDLCAEVEMIEIFEQSDILSLHIPLTDETRSLLNEQYFARFRKNIIVLNTARGEIIPLSALVWGIESGKIRGAALDVLENERINNLKPEQQQYFNYLRGQSNVIFTPHIAGWTYESHLKINVALVEKIRTMRGQK